jgi:bla regulator protein BlaR1
MQGLLFESAVRATLIAAAVALVLLVMRVKAASARHAVWAGVVVLMMLLPAWVAWGPKASLPVLPSQAHAAKAPVDYVPPPLPAGRAETAPRTSPGREDGGYPVVPAIYLLGFGLLLLRLAIGTVRASRLKSAVVPVTVGLLRPRIILPDSSHAWPQAQLDAVLTHEREHVRRRDPLFQWIALLNRAIFWFHPLAWWLERRLSELAEEACDAAVLSRGHDPREYSEWLLDLARSVQRTGLRVEGMAMPGIGLKYRIRRMLDGVPVPKLSRPRLACTIAVCAAAAAILAAGTLVRAQSSKSRAEFDVASIRPSNPNGGGGGGGKSKDGGPGPRAGLDHGRFNLSSTLFGLIVRAYGINGCGELRDDCALISGGPDWLKKSRFDIQAKMPDGSPEYTFVQFLRSQAPQLQLMLQALLEERFDLKVHRETKQLSVYALTVVKDGPKLKAASGEMIQLKDGSTVRNQSLLWTPTPLPDGTRSDHLIRMFVRDQSIQAVVDSLSHLMDRVVLDRTGLKGNFDITIDYERNPDKADTPGFDITGPAMFTAFQAQLGLKFESTKAPVEVLVIDHADKPSEN